MSIGSKKKVEKREGESLVVELFKLLDTWDKVQGRTISGKDGAGESAGLFVCEVETEQ